MVPINPAEVEYTDRLVPDLSPTHAGPQSIPVHYTVHAPMEERCNQFRARVRCVVPLREDLHPAQERVVVQGTQKSSSVEEDILPM